MWVTFLLLVLEIVAKLPQIETALKAILEMIHDRPREEKVAEVKRARRNIRGFLNGRKNAVDTLRETQDHIADLTARA